VSRVDAVCAAAVARHSGHAFPVSDFDPEHPDPRELPAVGDYFATYGGLPATTSGLHGLVPPADESATWRRLLDVADRLTANSERQVAAARARDVTTFIGTVRTANDLVAEINSVGRALGFDSSSPCHQVYG
jgi:hypothetical protein